MPRYSLQQESEWVDKINQHRSQKKPQPSFLSVVACAFTFLMSENIFYDETPLDMLDPGKGKTHQAYMWVLVGGKSSNPGYRVYDFCTNRCHYNAANMLRGYHGVLHSDFQNNHALFLCVFGG